MSDIDKDAELTILHSPKVQEQIDKDPELAKMIRSVNASFHQAFHGVQTGLYKDLDEAIASVTGGKVVKLGQIDPETNEFIIKED